LVLGAHPDSLDFVDSLPLPELLLDHLGGWFVSLFFSVIEAVRFFLGSDLKIVTFMIDVFNLNLAFWLLSVNWDLNLLLFSNVQTDGVVDEFRVLLDQVLDFSLISEFKSIFLQVKGDTGAAAKSVSTGIFRNEELVVSSRSPNVLLIILVLRGHNDFVSNEVS
jgi:hypothetical protein